MQYFLTGATGFIGGRLARQLVEAGHQVNAVVRDPAHAGPLAEMGVRLYQGDVTEKDSIRAAMTGCGGIFHVAGWYKIGTRDKANGERINVLGTRNVLELMKELSIPKGVYTSTLAVNSDTRGRLVDETYRFTGAHISEYDRSKAAAHDLAEEMIRAGLPLVIVMPGLVYGPGDTSESGAAIVQYLQRRLPIIPRGLTFAWAHVEDVAGAHILAMKKGRLGESYMINGPVHTLEEALRIAQNLTGIPLPPVVPPGIPRFLSGLVRPFERILGLTGAYTSEGLRVAAGVTYIGDNAKARRELGYAPRPLSVGMAELVEYEMKRLGRSK
jgi:nucleoside-diphosphate-sugar epimerase